MCQGTHKPNNCSAANGAQGFRLTFFSQTEKSNLEAWELGEKVAFTRAICRTKEPKKVERNLNEVTRSQDTGVIDSFNLRFSASRGGI